MKGGKLAQLCYPASIQTFCISDVVGDAPELISSGPTVESKFTTEDVTNLFEKYNLELPNSITELVSTNTGFFPYKNPISCKYQIISRPLDSITAGAQVAQNAGYETIILGDSIEGEASVVARDMAHSTIENQDLSKKLAFISGGKVTVSQNEISTTGSDHQANGGPNREFALTFALALNGQSNIHALMADTDGVDGQKTKGKFIAGAIIDPTTLTRAFAQNLDAEKALKLHQSGTFFHTLGDDIIIGPTHTNVNDFRVILIN